MEVVPLGESRSGPESNAETMIVIEFGLCASQDLRDHRSGVREVCAVVFVDVGQKRLRRKM